MSIIRADLVARARTVLAADPGKNPLELFRELGVRNNFLLFLAYVAGPDDDLLVRYIENLEAEVRAVTRKSEGRTGGENSPYSGGYVEPEDDDITVLRRLRLIKPRGKFNLADILRDIQVPRDRADAFVRRLVADPADVDETLRRFHNCLDASDREQRRIYNDTSWPYPFRALAQVMWFIAGVVEGFTGWDEGAILWPIIERPRFLVFLLWLGALGYAAFLWNFWAAFALGIAVLVLGLMAQWRKRRFAAEPVFAKNPLVPMDPDFWSGRTRPCTDPPRNNVMLLYRVIGLTAFVAAVWLYFRVIRP